MRRLFTSVFAIGFLVGMLTGCQNFFCHTAGVCDCDFDDDPCAHRAPWVKRAYPSLAGGGCANGRCGGRAIGAGAVGAGVAAPSATTVQPAVPPQPAAPKEVTSGVN